MNQSFVRNDGYTTMMNLHSFVNVFIVILMSLVLTACGSFSTDSGGDWSSTQDAAPRETIDVSTIPDAQPRPVVRTRAGNKSPYTVLGKTYRLLPDSRGYQERGYASWYGTKFHGRRTSNGEVYDMWAMTAAHKTLPIPSYVRVTNVQNGRSIVVKVNDRGPFHSQRIIDLSYAAAIKLGFDKQGVAKVDVIDVTPLAGDPQSSSHPTVATPVVSRDNGEVSAERKAENHRSVVSTVVPAASHTVNTSAAAIFLQVGAFQQLESAKSLQSKVQQLLNRSVNIVTGRDRWHRVRVGPIDDPQTISVMRQRLSRHGIQDTHVIYP